MSHIPVNQHFALSDFSIAIARDDLSAHSIIYIYPFVKEEHKTEKKEQKNKKQPINNDKYNIETRDQKAIRKLRYSGEPMDVTYSSRFMSLSKDGQYLAISWLPNPRMGDNIAMKYCAVYDLSNIDSNDNKSDEKLTPEIPCAIFEFQGGCTFTEDGKFVLIDDNKALIYSIHHDDPSFTSFNLDFSLRISTTISTILENDDGNPTFDFFPFSSTVSGEEVISEIKSSKTQNVTAAVHNDDNYDDIFFDNSENEFFSDLSDEDDKKEEPEEDDDWMEIDKLSDTDESVFEAEESCYQIYLRNVQFIRSNMESIRIHGVICLFSPFPHHSTSRDEIESSTPNLFVWSLFEKCLIFIKKLKDEEYGPNSSFSTAFSKQRNLVALCKNSDSTTHKMLGTIDNPLSTIYDCASGIAVANFYLPEGREISSIRQVTFLQDDSYLLTVSHSGEYIFFDLWDVLSTTYLDTCVKKLNEGFSCTEYSRFIINSNARLECSGFVKMSYRYLESSQTIEEDTTINVNNFNICIHKIEFFKDRNTEPIIYGCKCSKAAFYAIAESAFKINYVKRMEARDSLHNDRIFFLDKYHNYVMRSQKEPQTTGEDILLMTIWRVSHNNEHNEHNEHEKRELLCETFSQKHELYISFTQLIYSFTVNRNSFIYDRTGMIGHPTMFLDINVFQEYYIKYLEANMFYNDNTSNKTPLLFFKMNNYNSKKSILLDFLTENSHAIQDKKIDYILPVPLHPYCLLESHLHTLANESIVSLFDKFDSQRGDFHYNEYTKLINLNHDTRPDVTTPKVKLIEMVNSHSQYFSTLGGYATICRLARKNDDYDILYEILKESTKINYCTIEDRYGYSMDPLQESIKHGALKNTKLIVKHLKYSMATYGEEYGRLLLKHRALLKNSDISII